MLFLEYGVIFIEDWVDVNNNGEYLVEGSFIKDVDLIGLKF